MKDVFKSFLFTKHILVNEGKALYDADKAFQTIFAFANLLNIKITSGRKLATTTILKFAQEQLGVNVPEPFYRGFPNTVRKLTPDLLLLDQLVHYALTYGLNDFDGPAGHSIFERDFERLAFKEDAGPCNEFRIITEEDAVAELGRAVDAALASTRPLSKTLFDVVAEYVATYRPTLRACASKDTAAQLWLATGDAEFAKFLKLPDVVRIVERVNYALYVENNKPYEVRYIKKLRLPNSDRKKIARLLDIIFERGRVDEREIRECFEKKAIWQGVLHHIHYRPQTDAGKEFVSRIRGRGNVSVYAEFEKLMKDGKTTEAADALLKGKGAGALARNLDYIVSRMRNKTDVGKLLESLRFVNLPMLLQLIYHNFETPTSGTRLTLTRTFTFTRLNLLRVHRESPADFIRRKTFMPAATRKIILDALVDALRNALKNKLGKVYVDPTIGKLAVPLQESTAAGGFGVLPTGTRLPILRGKKIRAFTYWEKVNDIDISLFGLDKDGDQTEFSWRTMARRQSDAITFSGDETRGYYGGSEYFDVDLDEVRKQYPDIKWMIFCDNVFSGSPFSQCFCKAGFMYRDVLDSGAVYEPKTVQTSFLVDGDTTFKYLFAVDLETNEFVWLNVARKSSSLVAGENSMLFLVKYIERTKILTLNSLLKTAASEVVDDPAQADVVLSDKPVELVDGAKSSQESALRVRRDAVVLRSYDTERFLAFINGSFDAINSGPKAETLAIERTQA